MYEKAKMSAPTFLKISQSVLMKFSMLPLSVGMFKFIVDLLHTIIIQWKELCFGDFINYVFVFGCFGSNFFQTLSDDRHL